ncbi:MAG: FeoB-associated Cys-rich membrane protein [Spirochaetales bacterium]|nr:FeoB-associated Cys-rich membrane protein [Candidatus Physcosoma equi]
MNAGTLCVLVLLLLTVGAILWAMGRKKKKGGSSCSCGCSGCAFSGSCHKSH